MRFGLRRACSCLPVPVLALAAAACGGGGGGSAPDGGLASSPPAASQPVDSQPPTIEILAPAADGTFIAEAGTLALAGIARDDQAVAKVRWSTDQGAAGGAAGLDAWRIDAVPLAPGRTLVRVTASDRAGNEGVAVLDVTWHPGSGSAPVISGHPPLQVRKDEIYDFQPMAEDPDGDILHFRITNRPTWASFDETTGRLTGTPGPEDLGRHENIRITVSDGRHETSLPDFALEVVDGGQYSIRLSWVIPTERTDGSPLTNLAGYRIYYGIDGLDEQVRIDNPGITGWTIDALTAGHYQVAMTAFDSTGIEGERSNVVFIELGDPG